MLCELDFPDGFGSDIAKLPTYEDCGKRPSWSKAIASSTRSQPHDQSRSQRDNIRVGNLILREMKILLDCNSQQWRKRVPRPECDKEGPP